MYAEDVTRNISMMDEIAVKWESNLDPDQSFFGFMRTTILPQLILKTKAVKKAADRTATNTARRAANRARSENGTRSNRKLSMASRTNQNDLEIDHFLSIPSSAAMIYFSALSFLGAYKSGEFMN